MHSGLRQGPIPELLSVGYNDAVSAGKMVKLRIHLLLDYFIMLYQLNKSFI